MRDVKFTFLQRFAPEDRVVDDSLVTFEVIRDGYWHFPVGSKVEMRLVHIFEMRESHANWCSTWGGHVVEGAVQPAVGADRPTNCCGYRRAPCAAGRYARGTSSWSAAGRRLEWLTGASWHAIEWCAVHCWS
jgi:hypothetical protein